MTAAESNRLPVLQAEIRAAHETVIAAAQSAVERAISAGKLLLEAKSQLGYGEWLPGVLQAGLTPRTAQNYMRLAQLPEAHAKRVAHLGVRKALAEISKGVGVHEQISLATAAASLILRLLAAADAAAGDEELLLRRQIARYAKVLTKALSGFKACIGIDHERGWSLAEQGRWTEIDADIDDAEETGAIEALNGTTRQILAQMDALGILP
jgi:hypothetical protein